MSKRKLEIDHSDAGLKKQRGNSELDFSAMPVSGGLLNIQNYDIYSDQSLYNDLPIAMRKNIKNLHSLYKKISHKILVRTAINSIQEGRDDADDIGHNLALLAASSDSVDAIKQVIGVIADKKLKAKSIGAGLYRLAKVQSDAAVIKRVIDTIGDQNLKTKSIAIGLYLLFKDQEPEVLVGRLLSAIEDQIVITQVVNTSLYWLSKDISAVSKEGGVLTDSNIAQPVIVADEDASGLLGESSEL